MRRTLALLASAGVALSACGPADEGGPGGASVQLSDTPSESASASGTPVAATPGEGQFVNPVIGTDFPDPHVVRFEDTYYVYATGFKFSTSADLVDWGPAQVLEVRSPWALRDRWAPEVAQTNAGYVVYYTARSDLETPGEDTAQCLGRAVSATPEGPFVDELTEPWICQPELGGTIDASPFLDADGTRWLLYKNDGNCCSRPVSLWIQQLSEDGLSVVGEPIDLGIQADNRWEGAVVEAPTLWLHEGTYYLLYSANAYYDASYAVGYATAESVTGPYTEAEENPILHASFEDLREDASLVAAGPGHQSIVEDLDGDLWVAYHAWTRTAIGYPEGARSMWIDELSFEDGRAVIAGPDAEPQEVP